MRFTQDDEHWMRLALQEAEKALPYGDVPIGAVAVRDGVVIGRGFNRREADADPTAHAEMLAIREAARQIGHWRLENVTLYCTLEPCCMCAGAMILARLPRLVYAAIDPKAGCGGSVLDVLRDPRFNHSVHVDRGLMDETAAEQIRAFFRSLRSENPEADGDE
jgi:tRNA(adenine34) deaminase